MKRLFLLSALAVLSLGAAANPIDSCAYYKRKCDTLQHKYNMASFRLKQVQYYVNIVNKKPSQIKYLKGWVSRALR